MGWHADCVVGGGLEIGLVPFLNFLLFTFWVEWLTHASAGLRQVSKYICCVVLGRRWSNFWPCLGMVW